MYTCSMSSCAHALSTALLALCLVATPGCKQGRQDQRMTILHAGSLSVPFREVSKAFQRRHPGVRVLAEAAGSRDTARKVSDLGQRCDVLGSADYRVVENLLMPKHTDFNVVFATNEMTIAFTPRSRKRDRMTPATWHQVLLDPEVTFGRSDPNRDPCGYRTVMLFQLAERHHKLPGLAKKLAQMHGKRFIRPKETDLLALLEGGHLDYIFTYTSVARQHNLLHLRLPAEINLSSPALAERYKAARVQVTGKKPGQTITRVGAPIAYSVTIPRNAPRPKLALKYVDLLLSQEGRAIMERNGQRPIVPPRARGSVPQELRRHLGQGSK